MESTTDARPHVYKDYLILLDRLEEALDDVTINGFEPVKPYKFNVSLELDDTDRDELDIGKMLKKLTKSIHYLHQETHRDKYAVIYTLKPDWKHWFQTLGDDYRKSKPEVYNSPPVQKWLRNEPIPIEDDEE